MTLLSQRVIYHNTDITKCVNNFRSDCAVIPYQAGQYIYIGCEVPFNNLWWDIRNANNQTATPNIDVWWGNAWEPVVEIIDETRDDGRTLAKDGRMAWVLDWQKGWDIENESFRVAGLENFNIYEMYWLRLSFTANLANNFGVWYIGQQLCTEADLFDKYPDLNKEAVLKAFDDDKEDWRHQLYLATEDVIRSLKARGKIFHRGQIFDHTVWTAAAVEKTAELIYRGLGQAFENNRVLALREYEKAMKVGYDRLDSNLDGRLSQREKRAHTVYGSR